MMPEPVAVAADVDDVTVVEEAADQRGGGHHLVAEDLAPLLEALVAGEDGRGAFIAPGHDLEEQHGPGPGDREVADLVDDHQRGEAERLQAVRQGAGLLGFLQRGDQVGEGGIVDPATAFDRGDGQTQGEMGFPDPRRAQQDDVLMAIEKASRMETLEWLPFDRRLKGEVEVGQGLDRREPGGAHRGLQPAAVTQADLSVEQRDHRGRGLIQAARHERAGGTRAAEYYVQSNAGSINWYCQERNPTTSQYAYFGSHTSENNGNASIMQLRTVPNPNQTIHSFHGIHIEQGHTYFCSIYNSAADGSFDSLNPIASKGNGQEIYFRVLGASSVP